MDHTNDKYEDYWKVVLIQPCSQWVNLFYDFAVTQLHVSQFSEIYAEYLIVLDQAAPVTCSEHTDYCYV